MLSIIILNYNGCELTLRCVRSIFEHVKCDFEVLVVDNDSNRDEFLRLKESLPEECRLIRSCINTGFGAGNMLGANVAKGRFLCFLNNDVELTEDCITPLCRYLSEHENVGCITPRQFNGDGKEVPSFKHLPGIRHELLGDGLFERIFPDRYPARKDFSRTSPFEVKQINGCFMLFPSDKFWLCGGFDLNLFLYYEEYDISRRLAAHGLTSIVHTGYRFSHLHEATTKKSRAITKRELFISKMYAYRKHHNWMLSTVYRAINVLQFMVKPHKWYILPVVLRGEAMSQSMRHRMSGHALAE